MTRSEPFAAEGGCACGHVRYRMESRPLFVHCCHCRWCQRESGASFALNAMIEADRVTLLAAQPESVDTPSASGRGQAIARCPKCRIAVWSNYAGAGPLVRFVRVGTLDTPDLLPPDIHIFTASKQPWVVIPPGVPAVAEYYDRDKYWPAESIARRLELLPRIEALQAAADAPRPPATPRPMRKYLGSCHCGAVTFEIESDFSELTSCDCSICRRKNALMVKVHESRFKLLTGEGALTEYRFHTMTARHFFCRTCGIYPFHRKRVTPDQFGVNVFCLHDFDSAGIPVRPAVGATMI